MQTKTEKVISYFSEEKNYPDDNYVIKIRKEVIAKFLQGQECKNIIDIACGTGDVSIPFLTRDNKLTLIDISESMLERAKKNIPKTFENNVSLFCGNIEDMDLKTGGFDLVICTGLLAHVNAPYEMLKKIARLVSPGGYLVLQNTNSRHVYSYIIRFFYRVKHLIKKNGDPGNKISARKLKSVLAEKEFRLINQYTSIVSFLFFSGVLPERTKYNAVKRVFGTADQKRNQLLGNDVIYCFKKI